MRTCVDCKTELPAQTRGRPRLRCVPCVAAYKRLTRYAVPPRPCRGGCGTDLAGRVGVSYCAPCLPPGTINRGALTSTPRSSRAAP
jgi:hypothetical protein